MKAIAQVPLPPAGRAAYRLVRAPARPRDERGEVVRALLARPASISPKYFYDELGCALYGAICRLPEYYPTRTEAELFARHRAEIAAAMPRDAQFVDLGAGDCAKAVAWLDAVQPARYIAVDIAAFELERALARMAPDHPGIEMLGYVCDFSHGVELAPVLDPRPVVFFYPGSSIGNFAPDEALRFLHALREACDSRPGSGLLIGVDTKKEKRLLDAAYDDALGVTAAFNRNILLHLNRVHGFDFAIEAFVHRGFYNESGGRIEMHLELTCAQAVRLGEEIRRFEPGERIHTESSYKYHPAEFEDLLARAGFASCRRWLAPAGAFAVFYAS